MCVEVGRGVKLKPPNPQCEVNRQCLTLKRGDEAIQECYREIRKSISKELTEDLKVTESGKRGLLFFITRLLKY